MAAQTPCFVTIAFSWLPLSALHQAALDRPKSLASTGDIKSSRTLGLHCKVSEGLGILQLHERVDLHYEAWCPCPYSLEGIIILSDSDRGRERAVYSDQEDLERWKGSSSTPVTSCTGRVLPLTSPYHPMGVLLDYFAFPYPLFITSPRMLVQFILAGILRYSLPTTSSLSTTPTRGTNLLLRPSAVLLTNPDEEANKARFAAPRRSHWCEDDDMSNLFLKSIILSFYSTPPCSPLFFLD